MLAFMALTYGYAAGMTVLYAAAAVAFAPCIVAVGLALLPEDKLAIQRVVALLAVLACGAPIT